MKALLSQFIRNSALLAGAVLTLGSVRTLAADKALSADAFPTFDSYIKVSGQAASISGDEAAFQNRTRQKSNGGLGIEDLHLLKDVAENTSLTIDGRALSQTEDYLLSLKLDKNEVGSFDIGYKRFRTFYDGVGGFFPVTGSFMKLNPQDLHLDRGEFWAEVKVARPNAPEFTLRYTDGMRNGQKDSISWGDSDNSGQTYRMLNGGLSVVGVSATSNSNATVRKNTPSYFDVDERNQALEGTVKHTMGKTVAQLALVGEKSSKNNFHYVTRFSGETLGVLPGATVIVAPVAFVTPASQWMSFNNEVDQSTYDIQDTTTKAVVLTTVTELTPEMDLLADVKYEHVTATSSGDRMTVTNAPITGNLTRTLTAYAVKNLVGRSQVDGWKGKLALDYKVSSDFTANFAVASGDENASGKSTFDVVTASTANPPVFATTSRLQNSVVHEKSLTPVLDLRYTGFQNLSLYATIGHKKGTGTDNQTPAYNPATTSFAGVIYRDVSEDNYDYTVGANWRAQSALSVRAEAFYKDHSFQATGWNTNTNAPTASTYDNNYQLDLQLKGVKLTAVVKPTNTLSFTTRYIYQKGQRQVTGFLALYPEYDSMDMITHNLGVTMDWNPNQQFYLQANADMVFNTIKTASLHNLSVANAGVVPANYFIGSSDNNYVTGSLVAGTVLSKTDDLQVQFTYYKADNYYPSLALYTQPYGAGAKEVSVTVGVKHKFSDRIMGNAKVGYFDSKNDTTGGNTNFRGPLAYVSLDYAL